MRIDLFCTVVDNYGDIAVVWRLTKSLLAAGPEDLEIRIFVDDLKTFRALNADVDDRASRQMINWLDMCGRSHVVRVFDSSFLEPIDDLAIEITDVLIEAFGVRTPESYLASFRDAAETKKKVVLHLEYLTAEPWAKEYHLLPSPQPWPGVEKYFYVPGFVEGSGGVFFDEEFEAKFRRAGGRRSIERREFRARVLSEKKIAHDERTFVATVFSYEHSYSKLFEDWATFWKNSGFREYDRAVFVTFEGLMKAGVVSGWEESAASRSGVPMELKTIEFLTQNEYDDLVLAGDFHVVRGEESWMRAVLGARAHLWHAYLQPDGYQSVKVGAYLDVLKPYVERIAGSSSGLFEEIAKETTLFNARSVNDASDIPREGYRTFFENLETIEAILRELRTDLVKNRDLSRLMLDFLVRTCV